MLSDISNMSNEGIAQRAALISAKTKEMHQTNIISGQGVALLSSFMEPIVGFGEWEIHFHVRVFGWNGVTRKVKSTEVVFSVGTAILRCTVEELESMLLVLSDATE